MTDLPEPLQNLPASELEGESFFKVSEVIKAIGVERTSVYKYLRELGISPRKVKGSSYVEASEAIALLEYSRFISEGGNLKGCQERQSSALFAPTVRGELVAPEPDEPEDTGVVDLESLEYLERAAQCGW